MSKSAINHHEYERTHPWIKFVLDLSKFDYEIWLLLGEAKSKCDHIKSAPLLPESFTELMRVYLAKGALATTAIEGNTLSEDQVQQIIKKEIELPPSQEYLGKEVLNIIKAVNDIGNQVLSTNSFFISFEEICGFNRKVMKDLEVDEGVKPGILRNYSVGVGKYRAVPYQDLGFLMEEYVGFINKDFSEFRGKEIILGIIKAIISHVIFVLIHPFGDGNGRTARLVEFKLLLNVGVPAAAAHLLSNHYNKTRSEYYRQLDYVSRNDGDYAEFLKYALRGFVDGLAEQLEYIRKDQLFVHWINYVHNSFDDKKREEDKRRRDLVLELTKIKDPVEIGNIRMISGTVAARYAKLSDKTIARDLAILISMNLLTKDKKRVKCNYDVIKAFISPAIK